MQVRSDEVRLLDVYLGQTVEEIEHMPGGWKVFRNAEGEAIGSAAPGGTLEVERPEPPAPGQTPACWVEPVDFAMSGCRFGAFSFTEDPTFCQPLYSEPVVDEAWQQVGWAWEERSPMSGRWYPRLSETPPAASESVRSVRAAYVRREA